MHPHALSAGERIAQLKECDVGILRDQFLKESLMRCRLSPATRRALWCGFSMAVGSKLTRPPCTCGGQNLQTQCRRPPA